jgi:PilZ domain
MPKGTGNRRHGRVAFNRPGFLVLEPDGPWIECFIVDVSEGGACINVGALAVPETFVLLLSLNGEVRRLCQLVWRSGELLGARFLSAKELGRSNCQSSSR